MKNKYYNRSQISEKKFREVIKYFSYDFDATKIALLTKISRNTVNKIIGKIRKKIFLSLMKEEKFSGEFELDESYFGAKRIRGKRGRGQLKKPLYLDY